MGFVTLLLSFITRVASETLPSSLASTNSVIAKDLETRIIILHNFLQINISYFFDNHYYTGYEMLQRNRILKICTKPGNYFYLVWFVKRTKPGTVLSETVLSGEPCARIKQK